MKNPLKKPYYTIAIIAIIFILLDRISKEFLVAILYATPNKEIPLLPFFDLTMVWNYGISFGMFQSPVFGHYIFPTIALIVSIILFIWCVKKYKEGEKRRYLNACGLIIAGAVGNSIDRFQWGAVADFFYFNYGKLFFPAFNVADVAIFFGAVILIIDSFIHDGKKS